MTAPTPCTHEWREVEPKPGTTHANAVKASAVRVRPIQCGVCGLLGLIADATARDAREGS